MVTPGLLLMVLPRKYCIYLKQIETLHLKCDQNISFMCHWGKFKEYFICNQGFFFLIIQYSFTWQHQAYYKLYHQENTVFILRQMDGLHLKCDQNISFMCHSGKFKEYVIYN
jgi:hypothetical protein